MAKSLSERIAARTLKKKPSRSGQNLAAFLALRADIKDALDDGWPVKTICETLQEEGKITFSYQAFRGYVNRLILLPATTSTPAAEVRPTPPSIQTAKSPAGKKSAAGFSFNATPNKSELL